MENLTVAELEDLITLEEAKIIRMVKGTEEHTATQALIEKLYGMRQERIYAGEE